MSSRVDGSFSELCERLASQDIKAEPHPSYPLEVNVIFTDDEGTLAALKTAGALALHLRARIKLLAFQVVPFAFPLTRPPVAIPFTEQRLLDFACQGAQGPLDTDVNLYLCRDPRQAPLRALEPRSLVVIGGRARWWPTRETRLANALRSKGHQVIFVPIN